MLFYEELLNLFALLKASPATKSTAFLKNICKNINIDTFEPVFIKRLSGTILSGHPWLSGHVAKSRKFRNTNSI